MLGVTGFLFGILNPEMQQSVNIFVVLQWETGLLFDKCLLPYGIAVC